jgi:uncharacterized metal-binding protein
MPSGNVHNAATTSIILSLGVVYALKVDTPLELAAVGVGAMANYFMSPDLDVDNGFQGFAKLRRFPIIGKVLAFVWRAVWWPYAIVVKHRSWVSHAPIISTLIRIGYLYAVIWLSAIVLRVNDELAVYVIRGNTGEFLRLAFLVFCGLCLMDISHYFLDNAEPNSG